MLFNFKTYAHNQRRTLLIVTDSLNIYAKFCKHISVSMTEYTTDYYYELSVNFILLNIIY